MNKALIPLFLFWASLSWASGDCGPFLGGGEVESLQGTPAKTTLGRISNVGRYFPSPDGKWLIVTDRWGFREILNNYMAEDFESSELMGKLHGTKEGRRFKSKWALVNLENGEATPLVIEVPPRDEYGIPLHTKNEVHYRPDSILIGLYDDQYQAHYIFDYEGNQISAPRIETAEWPERVSPPLFDPEESQTVHGVRAADIKPPFLDFWESYWDRPEEHSFTRLRIPLKERDSVIVGVKTRERGGKFWLVEISSQGKVFHLFSSRREFERRNVHLDESVQSLVLTEYPRSFAESWSRFHFLDLKKRKLKMETLEVPDYWDVADYRYGRLVLGAAEFSKQKAGVMVYNQNRQFLFKAELRKRDWSFSGENTFISVDESRFMIQGDRAEEYLFVDLERKELVRKDGHIMAFNEDFNRMLTTASNPSAMAWGFRAGTALQVLDLDGQLVADLGMESLNISGKRHVQFLSPSSLIARERGEGKDPIQLLKW